MPHYKSVLCQKNFYRQFKEQSIDTKLLHNFYKKIIFAQINIVYD